MKSVCLLPMGAKRVVVEPQNYANHNGWVRRAVAECPAGRKSAALFIAPQQK